MAFQDLVMRLPNSTYLDLVDQPGPDAEEFESPLTQFREDGPVGSDGETLPGASSSSHARPDGPAPAQPLLIPPSTDEPATEPPNSAPEPPQPQRSRLSRSLQPRPLHADIGDTDMSETRARPDPDPATDETTSSRPRRLRQKTGPNTEASTGGVFETLGGKGGENSTFSYEEALRKSSPALVGFTARGPHIRPRRPRVDIFTLEELLAEMQSEHGRSDGS